MGLEPARLIGDSAGGGALDRQLHPEAVAAAEVVTCVQYSMLCRQRVVWLMVSCQPAA
jgi:hypothetical protein